MRVFTRVRFPVLRSVLSRRFPTFYVGLAWLVPAPFISSACPSSPWSVCCRRLPLCGSPCCVVPRLPGVSVSGAVGHSWSRSAGPASRARSCRSVCSWFLVVFGFVLCFQSCSVAFLPVGVKHLPDRVCWSESLSSVPFSSAPFSVRQVVGIELVLVLDVHGYGVLQCSLGSFMKSVPRSLQKIPAGVIARAASAAMIAAAMAIRVMPAILPVPGPGVQPNCA